MDVLSMNRRELIAEDKCFEEYQVHKNNKQYLQCECDAEMPNFIAREALKVVLTGITIGLLTQWNKSNSFKVLIIIWAIAYIFIFFVVPLAGALAGSTATNKFGNPIPFTTKRPSACKYAKTAPSTPGEIKDPV